MMETTIQPTANDLRRSLAERGDLPTIADAPLLILLKKMNGNIELAADAIQMVPRPKWLRTIIG